MLLPVRSPAFLRAVHGGAVVARFVMSFGVREGSTRGALGVFALDERVVGAVVCLEGGEGGFGVVVGEVGLGGAQGRGVEAGAAVAGGGAGLREGLAPAPRALALRGPRPSRLLHRGRAINCIRAWKQMDKFLPMGSGEGRN